MDYLRIKEGDKKVGFMRNTPENREYLNMIRELGLYIDEISEFEYPQEWKKAQ